MPAVLRAVRGTERGGDPIEAIADHLPAEPVLLVLDNLEQLIPGVVHIARLLEAIPTLTILATSRERLRLRAEHEVSLDGLRPESARELFVTRAEAAGTPIGDDGSADVEELCRHVAGMPLAIELAAGQLHSRDVATLLAEMQRSLSVLSQGAADLPTRHQALFATIAWSWDLLDRDAQRVLASLAVVGGTVDVSLIEALAGAAGVERATEEIVESLIDKNLLQPADSKPDEPRVAILEVIRQFAEDRLCADPDAHLIAVRTHAAWFGELAARADRYLGGPDEGPWLDRLDLDRENLALALVRSDGDVLFELVEHLPKWWTSRGLWSEARQWIGIALENGSDDARLVAERVGAQRVLRGAPGRS